MYVGMTGGPIGMLWYMCMCLGIHGCACRYAMVLM